VFELWLQERYVMNSTQQPRMQSGPEGPSPGALCMLSGSEGLSGGVLLVLPLRSYALGLILYAQGVTNSGEVQEV